MTTTPSSLLKRHGKFSLLQSNLPATSHLRLIHFTHGTTSSSAQSTTALGAAELYPNWNRGSCGKAQPSSTPTGIADLVASIADPRLEALGAFFLADRESVAQNRRRTCSFPAESIGGASTSSSAVAAMASSPRCPPALGSDRGEAHGPKEKAQAAVRTGSAASTASSDGGYLNAMVAAAAPAPSPLSPARWRVAENGMPRPWTHGPHATRADNRCCIEGGTCNHFNTDSKVKSSAYGFSTIMTGRIKERETTNKLPRSTRAFLGSFRLNQSRFRRQGAWLQKRWQYAETKRLKRNKDLVNFQRISLKKACICWNDVSKFNADYVTGNQQRCIQFTPGSIT